MTPGRRLLPLALACLGAFASGLAAQDPPPPPPDSSRATAEPTPPYTSAQARRGQSTYEKHCVNCHAASAHTGAAFRRAWGNRTAYELWEQIRTTMPQDGPGKLSPREYADIVAYLLKLNRLPAGPTELPADPERLREIVIRVPTPGH